MKIRAIRLKEVGRFSEPIALEGLSGDLDVLAGPNSTRRASSTSEVPSTCGVTVVMSPAPSSSARRWKATTFT